MRLVVCAAALSALPTAALTHASNTDADAVGTAYHTHAGLDQWIDRLSADHADRCAAETIGTSREGRSIQVLRIANPGDVDPDKRPALLLVANIDGDHLLGSEVAMHVTEQLLNANATDSAFLDTHSVYVIPRVNPDAAERFFGDTKRDWRRNLRPDDADRDRATDEDPPDDLNGDGLITMMRVPDPKKASMMVDEVQPRLNVTARPDRGEHAAFVVMVEGADDDGDGAYNEDAIGGVDLNRNFMHGWKEHADGAGPHQVSEPESLALLQFVLAHQNIAVVLTYGVHDTLSSAPNGKGTLLSGAPKNIMEDDVPLYTEISRRFVELTDLKEADGAASEGAFHAWAYAQFGVPSFATPLWVQPTEQDAETTDASEENKDENKNQDTDDDSELLTPSPVGDISQETLDELADAAAAAGIEVTDEMRASITPAEVDQYAAQMGIAVRRVKKETPDDDTTTEKANSKGDKKPKTRDKTGARWLKYSDEERDGAGFVEWTPFDHPQLGAVEIGGFVPYFRTNPPAAELPALAEKQYAFVVDLLTRLPDVHLEAPEVTQLADGLYEIKTALVNEGYFPTGTAMSVRNRRARPHVVRLSIDNEHIITGQRVNKIWSVAGSGGREDLRWIIRADDNTPVRVTVYSEKFGSSEHMIDLSNLQGGEL